MAKDKFKAVWVSHSSIADFLRCPRLYFLRNVYKDPKTRRKMTIMTPPLALGQAVHEVIESLASLPAEERLKIAPRKRFDASWQKISGKLGGFADSAEEKEYKARGEEMLGRLEQNPGPILNKAIKIKTGDGLPYYWLSEDENIILCGKVDWLEYLEADDSIHIIDFKTGRGEEADDSLQLPIYHLLVNNTQGRHVSKASYWYLDKDEGPVQMALPDLADAHSKVFEVAKRMKLGRQIEHLKCPYGGCFACTPLERILKGEGEKVTVSQYNQDIFILK